MVMIVMMVVQRVKALPVIVVAVVITMKILRTVKLPTIITPTLLMAAAILCFTVDSEGYLSSNL